MSKIFVITSGKGGVGKTTTAINLAAAINSFKEDVIVVDANFSTPNVGLHLGAPIVPVSLSHVLQGKAKVDEAIYEHESGTKILPCSISIKENGKINHEKLHDVMRKLRKISDYIVLDSSAGLGEEALTAMKAGDEIIIVTNPELPSVTDALKTAKIAENLGKQITGVIVTRVRKDGLDMPYSNLKEMLNLPVIGVIPEDKAVRKALVKKDAVFHAYPKSKSARAYREVASRLTGKQIKYSFSQRVLRSLGMR